MLLILLFRNHFRNSVSLMTLFDFVICVDSHVSTCLADACRERLIYGQLKTQTSRIGGVLVGKCAVGGGRPLSAVSSVSPDVEGVPSPGASIVLHAKLVQQEKLTPPAARPR